jgi:hypothetical protein
MIEPEFKIDENSSICNFKIALIKEIIINQDFLQSLYSICLFAILLEIKEDQTDRIYIQSFLQIMKRSAAINSL